MIAGIQPCKEFLLDPRVPRYNSDEELYEAHPELEAVVIASDNKSHIAQVREAVKRGLHIYSMKVPTFDLDEYREMIELTEKAGVVFQIELELRISDTMENIFVGFENRMASLLFKLSVEMAMMMHVTAANNEIDEETLSALRGMCVEEVKRLYGRISFEDVVRFQKE